MVVFYQAEVTQQYSLDLYGMSGWRDTATGTLSNNPEKASKEIAKVVEKMFKKNPLQPRT